MPEFDSAIIRKVFNNEPYFCLIALNLGLMDIKRPLLTALGKHLRSKRRKRGKSLRTLSEEMGLSKGNISNIELGLRDPRFSTLAAMAASLGFTVSTLLEDFKPTEKQLDQILERRTKKLK